MFIKTFDETVPGNKISSPSIVIPKSKRKQAVVITAFGQSSYGAGGGVNAGIIVSIECSGTNRIISDDSFEGTSSSITFRASASFIFQIDPDFEGWVKATVQSYGAGGAKNKNTSLNLTVLAIAE